MDNIGTNLKEQVVELLIKNKLSCSTVESCTGGLLSANLIDVPGVSEVFKAGIVSYSNKAKKKIVGVKKSTLKKYGAVSAEVAREMVKGMHRINKSDVIVSTTGIAGPGGGTDKKPVGLVYIACYVCGTITVREYHFDGDRTNVRNQSVTAALELMLECMKAL